MGCQSRAKREPGDHLKFCDSQKQMMPAHSVGKNPVNEKPTVRGKSGHTVLHFSLSFFHIMCSRIML